MKLENVTVGCHTFGGVPYFKLQVSIGQASCHVTGYQSSRRSITLNIKITGNTGLEDDNDSNDNGIIGLHNGNGSNNNERQAEGSSRLTQICVSSP